MKKVIFYNHWHNGDVHVSRGIVKQIMKKVHQIDSDVQFIYSHANSPALLSDIDNLAHDPSHLSKLDPHHSVTILDDMACINTWYDQQYQKYARQYGILTIDALYAALDESCKQLWNFSLEEITTDITEFFPSIDYRKFDISKIESWLDKHPGRKILVENGNALSGQAHNFNMTHVIIRLANENPNITFILSNNDQATLPNNVFYTNHIIEKQSGSDLNEISFLSSHCDTIIGRASGVFSFSLTQENLFKRNVKFLCFSHLVAGQQKFWLGKRFSDKLSYSSTFTINATSNINDAYVVIKGNL